MSDSSHQKYLKAKIQIGNTKGPLNYKMDQVVFHHDDVPEDKRFRKESIQDWKASRTLGGRQDPWNISNNPNKPVVERKSMENYKQDRSHQYQYNYRAETIDTIRNISSLDRSTKFHVSSQLESTAKEIMEIRERDPIQRGRLHRTEEMPVHPNLEYAEPWNHTTVLTLNELNQGLDRMTEKAKTWTGKVTATIPEKMKYIGPMKSVTKLQQEIRQLKQSGQFSTQVKMLTRPVSEPPPPEKPHNRYLNEKIRKVITTEHSGVWEYSRVDGRHMWSDTGSYVLDSRGDVKKTLNLDASNMEGPVKGSRNVESSGSASRHQSRPSTSIK